MEKIKISKEFQEAMKESARELVRTGAERVVMKKPFEGFFVSMVPQPNRVFKVVTPSELEVEGFNSCVYVICENFFGEKSEEDLNE